MQSAPIALITGATRGIGKASAVALAERGFRVIASGRNPDLVEAVRTEMGARGHTLETVVLDVSDRASIDRACAFVDELTGGYGVDVLVNNAGYGAFGPLEALSDTQLRSQFETNVFGLFNVTRALLPAMRRRRSGRIINISSVGGRVTFATGGAYCATKYAVEALSHSLRQEMALFGVRVSLIEPGPIATDFTATALAGMDIDTGIAVWDRVLHRMQRIGSRVTVVSASPAAVARAVTAAATARSPRSRYVVSVAGHAQLALATLLPTPVLDRGIQRLLGLPKRAPQPPRGRPGNNRSAAAATVLITGAAGGIGSAAVRRLAGDGHRVIATDIDTDRLAALAASMRAQGMAIETFALDVRDAASIAGAAAAVADLSPAADIDVLINNAGYAELGPIEMVSEAALRAQFDVNVFGLMAVTRAFVPAMRRRGAGRIINISSIAGLMAAPFMGLYHASKFAVEALSDALRQELGPFGIDVVTIEPSFIDSRFAMTAKQTSERYDPTGTVWQPFFAEMDAVVDRMKRVGGQPDDVAAVIHKAVVARSPRPRYQAPMSATIAVHLAALTPVWLGDYAWSKLFGLHASRIDRAS